MLKLVGLTLFGLAAVVPFAAHGQAAESAALFCQIANCKRIGEQILLETNKAAVCTTLASKCPESKLDGGFQRCKEIYGKFQSVQNTAEWKKDFIGATQSPRTICYARSLGKV